jgi:outer membrane immunogenic protein
LLFAELSEKGTYYERPFTPNWTVKGEYLYISAIGTGSAKNELNLLRFGVNYKF